MSVAVPVVRPPASADLARTVAQRLLRAIARGDRVALVRLLADDVWVRALLTREVAEAWDAQAAADLFTTWVSSPADVTVQELVVEDLSSAGVGGRARVRYRLRLRPTWAPDTWHVIEQMGYLKVGADGRITRADIACTGYHPE